MELIRIALGIAAAAAIVILGIAYIGWHMAFYASERTKKKNGEVTVVKGAVYEPYREQMAQWAQMCRETPCEEVEITSFDGLRLGGRYYEYAPDAPIELMFHGYRGTAQRDLSGGLERCFALGHSALIVCQRAAPGSEGNVISFGINEHRDCLSWLDFVLRRFGPGVRVILCGISMGAATVLMTADRQMPPNVMGILADCGYTDAKEIIRTVIGKMGLPADMIYPLVRLGAKLYGRFDPEETSALEAMKKSTVPIIFFHGEEDDFVPCDMSRRNYEACTSEKKKLVTIPGAGHGLCYAVAPEVYLSALREFFG